jgi:hypothetical protein
MDLFFKRLNKAYQVSKEKIDDALHQIVPEPLLAPHRVSNEAKARAQIAQSLEQELSTVTWVCNESEDPYVVLNIFPQDTGKGHHTLRVGIIPADDRRYVTTLSLSDFLKNFTPYEVFTYNDS